MGSLAIVISSAETWGRAHPGPLCTSSYHHPCYCWKQLCSLQLLTLDSALFFFFPWVAQTVIDHSRSFRQQYVVPQAALLTTSSPVFGLPESIPIGGVYLHWIFRVTFMSSPDLAFPTQHSHSTLYFQDLLSFFPPPYFRMQPPILQGTCTNWPGHDSRLFIKGMG